MSAQRWRLGEGGLIDRSRVLPFRFDERLLHGHPGDTLASALLANGVRLVGRSFKYHRPRGILSAGPEEPNALVELRGGARREPNTRATQVELFEGLEARSQNRWPSLGFDLGAVNGVLAPMIGAGFYYKTFMWPAAFWEKLYEPLIRRAAGLGRAPQAADPDRYERAHAHCDVLVIGAGPAGLMAALAAGRAGARVLLVEEDAALGGRLLSEAEEVDGRPGAEWAGAVEAELADMPRLRILRRTSAFALLDGGVVAAVERVADHLPEPPAHLPRQRSWKIVARRIVLAAGAIERPVVFGGNDRPGVMLAGAVRSYLNRHAVLPGRRAVVFTVGDDGWRSVADLLRGGAQIDAVVDARAEVPPEQAQLAARHGLRLVAGGRVTGTQGGRHLTAVRFADAAGREEGVGADLLAVSGGWNPSLHLACHLGNRPRWDAAIHAFVPGELPPGLVVAGAAAGRFSTHAALADGAATGLAAAQACGFDAAAPEIPRAEDAPRDAVPLFHVPGGRGKAFVDLQHDVTDADIALAHREGFRAAEHAKRYTTLGMATDQGKTAGVNGLAILARLAGQAISEVGTTTHRPPWTPVAIGAVAGPHRGRHFRPARHTPLHDWAAANGASFVEAGLWYRAQWYARPGEAGWRDSVDREVLAVRNAVGVCDVSTLGKIEVAGPGAAALLDLVYANTISTLAVGRLRYGLMLREDGFVMDDGTVARLAEDRFFVTTTTANAGAVLQHLEYCHQVLRPALDVSLLSVTDAWAQLSVAGPRARDLLAAVLDPGPDLSNAALPHMAWIAVRLGGVPCRLYRLSFSGELAYELGVPADYAEAAMRRIMERGASFGVTPYGTEALGVLRIEKGHPAGGELNGQTTARDLGLGRLVSTRKDCIGRRLAERPALTDPARPVLVGLKPADGRTPIRAGSHLLEPGVAAVTANGLGHVTSACFSPTLGMPIALALLSDGTARLGQRIRVFDPLRGGDLEAEICPPVFVDPQGERSRG
ncbi:sarcosine oxidase subunit alpha [Falsiroseomonas bella]|uniref:Sarcosine oxidase subunit alpha n=1 Tax=Falsiroseomonas bella TaxID=2184016 RepID=A0A317FFD5_9PROT|nr:sarcosine oxidase subunit alpha family protein [Falsiroseomonas bella]PWS37082.1 sarcosine oxidase subunit alpha [Falsiroseomonas bella]